MVNRDTQNNMKTITFTLFTIHGHYYEILSNKYGPIIKKNIYTYLTGSELTGSELPGSDLSTYEIHLGRIV